MLSSWLAACLLAGFATLGGAQEPGRKPARPTSPPAELAKDGALPSLVNLPADFVQYARLPEAARRPRLAVGKSGVALLYSVGDGSGVDLHLAMSTDEGKSFSPGVRLNAQPGTVLSWNKTQSGSIDVAADERVHVAWIEGGERPALRYVRTTPAGEPEAVQDLGAPEELGTTTALAVDGQGQVHVFYSAGGPTPSLRGSPGARVWMRRSADGTSFEEPVAIDPDLNVSMHSDLAAHVDEGMGTLHVLYRTAFKLKESSPVVSRSMRLLSSNDRGATFNTSVVDNTRQVRDPVAGAGLSQQEDSTLAAWEADGRVCWSIIRRQVLQTQLPVEPRSVGRGNTCTNPVGSAEGSEVILTWLERPAKDGSAAPRIGWQVWLREGRLPLGEGQAPETPLGDGHVVVPRRGGGFTIVY